MRKLAANVVKSDHAQNVMNQIDFASFETDNIDQFIVHCKFCLIFEHLKKLFQSKNQKNPLKLR